MFRTMLIAAATSSMAANSASDSTVELRCRSCKVTQTVRREDKGAHRECPYCGAFYDAELENALGVTTAFRSASARSLRFVIYEFRSPLQWKLVSPSKFLLKFAHKYVTPFHSNPYP